MTPRPPGRKASKASGKQKGESTKRKAKLKDAMDQQNIVDLDKTENLKKFITNIEELRKEKKIYHEDNKRQHEDNMMMQLMNLDPSKLDEDQLKLYKRQLGSFLHDE